MKYQIDHDLHIHSRVSICSNDPAQSTERILEYAKTYGLKHICVTDHFWDKIVPNRGWPFYQEQDFDYISQALPLPQREGIQFHFGCETDMLLEGTVGIAPETMDKFEFIIVPTTHLHMGEYVIKDDPTPADRAEAWVKRFRYLLDADLPFGKVGMAHLACGLIYPGGEIHEVLSLILDETMEVLFAKAAQLGVGIEINADDWKTEGRPPQRMQQVLRMFRIAKQAGCKFYLGSDAHHPDGLDGAIPVFESAIALLELKETDKFLPANW